MKKGPRGKRGPYVQDYEILQEKTEICHAMIPPQELSKGHKFKVFGEAQFKGKA
jgi:hypothetical protein